MSQTIAIVQARMGSTRLPGKVLKPILGEPMLAHLLRRLKHAQHIDKIVVATSTAPQDDPIVNFLEQFDMPCYRGNEADVMDRVYQAACLYGADPIVRITADCPLVDPQIVDHVIQQHKNNDGDLTLNSFRETYPDGLDVEVYAFSAFKKCWQDAPPGALREHLYAYILKNPEVFNVHHVVHSDNYSAHCWSVDSADDFAFVTEVFTRLNQPNQIFHMQNILNLLNQCPQLRTINANGTRNSWKAEVGL